MHLSSQNTHEVEIRRFVVLSGANPLPIVPAIGDQAFNT
jgi:hypothetical protein